jgi:hypothetical protein
MSAGRPMSEAPRDGTVIIASLMRISGVPETGHYCFKPMSFRQVHGFGGPSWYEVGPNPTCYCDSPASVLAWWPEGTPESEMEKRERTNFKWRPSNGSSGEGFYNSWCERCIHERPVRKDYEKAVADGLGCQIFLRTMAHDLGDPEYPEEWTDRDGTPKCTAFVEDTGDAEQEPPYRCDATPDLFGGSDASD